MVPDMIPSRFETITACLVVAFTASSRRHLSFLILATLLFLPGKSAAVAMSDSMHVKRTVSVLDFQSNSPDLGSMGVEVAGAIGARILSLDRFQVIERTQVQKILQEQGFENSGACDGSNCQVQMGRLLGVDWIVTGSVGQIPGGYSTNIRLLEISTGRILYQKHDVFQGNVVTYLTERVPDLGEQIFRGRPEAVQTDSLIEMKEGDVKVLVGSVKPSIAPQAIRMGTLDGKVLLRQGPLQLKAQSPGDADLYLMAEADTSVRRLVHVRIHPDEALAKKRRSERIRWIGSGASVAIATTAGVLGYLNNSALKNAQRDYDAADTQEDIRSARSRMDQKVLLRNLGYGTALAGLLGFAGFQVLF
jgi:Curli production assembly/transport component CsgG